MPVKYNVIPRRNLNDEEAPPKYYPILVSNGRSTVRSLSRKIAEMSTVSSTDLVAALEAFLSVIPRELADGHIVDLGDFGSFRLSIKGTGQETAEQVSSGSIDKVRVRFFPGKEFKRSLQDIEFVKNSG